MNGLACDGGTDCKSGNCEPAGDDGGMVCCAASCGTCETCDGDGAACAPVAKGDKGPGCTGSAVACDGANDCKVQNGGACPDDGGDVCMSGICANGVCCTMACPACQFCKADGSGCANRPIFYLDQQCLTLTKTCNGGGFCF